MFLLKLRRLNKGKRFILLVIFAAFVMTPVLSHLIREIKGPTAKITDTFINRYSAIISIYTSDHSEILNHKDSLLSALDVYNQEIDLLFLNKNRKIFNKKSNEIRELFIAVDSTEASYNLLRNRAYDFKDILHDFLIYDFKMVNKIQQDSFSETDYISFIIALAAILISFVSIDENNRLTRLKENYNTHYSNLSSIEKDPSLLKIHGLSKSILKDKGISVDEFVYILKNFNSLSSYYMLRGTEIVDFNEYRKDFLNSKKVKKAWKYFIRKKFICYDKIVNAVDSYYEEK